MNEAEALSRAISVQLAAAVAINTTHGDIPLDDEMRAAVDNALRPILKRRLNAVIVEAQPQQ
ncbi:TPA: hypothetical protein ACKROF_005955 [Pseudomonas aeruginosa]